MNAPSSTLLCSDPELAYLKRAIQEIEEATRILKKSNDEALKVRVPRTGQEWKQYGHENPNW